MKKRSLTITFSAFVLMLSATLAPAATFTLAQLDEGQEFTIVVRQLTNAEGKPPIVIESHPEAESEPGAAAVTLLPKITEHAEPGGVNWITRQPSPEAKSASSLHPSVA